MSMAGIQIHAYISFRFFFSIHDAQNGKYSVKTGSGA
jgi:hypothetical protein